MGHNLSGLRGRQILLAIREHGPLSINAITSFLEPSTNRRRVAQAMKLLSDKGAVRKINSSFSNKSGHHFALNMTDRGRDAISEIIGIEPNEITAAVVPAGEFKHAEQCAFMAERFKAFFPEAQVWRDWELHKSRKFKENATRSDNNLIVLPDFVIEFARSDSSEPVLIGVEIERTRKWVDRLNRRMEALVYNTMLDGVLYICDQICVAEGVRKAFVRGNFIRSRRIGNYAKNFLLFSSFDTSVEITRLAGVNVHLEPVNIAQWIGMLRSVSQQHRCDSLFGSVAQCGYSKK